MQLLPGCGLWIATVDVFCVMFGLGLMVCRAVIATKLSTPHLVLLSGTIDSQADGEQYTTQKGQATM